MYDGYASDTYVLSDYDTNNVDVVENDDSIDISKNSESLSKASGEECFEEIDEDVEAYSDTETFEGNETEEEVTEDIEDEIEKEVILKENVEVEDEESVAELTEESQENKETSAEDENILEIVKDIDESELVDWYDEEYGDIADKFQIANRNSTILEWEGENGNSLRIPKDKAGDLSKELEMLGAEGIPYINGDVDFSDVSKYEVEFADAEKLYAELGTKIKFGDLLTEDGIKTRSKFNGIIRTKWQSLAKQQIVEQIATDDQFAKDFSDRTGIDASTVTNASRLDEELKNKGLTLHETTDCKKIQFVPTNIHDSFKHAGGTAEMLERLINGDIHNKIGI